MAGAEEAWEDHVDGVLDPIRAWSSRVYNLSGAVRLHGDFARNVRTVADYEFDLADEALDGSVFRMLRQGQRVLFVLDEDQRATSLSLGSEVDMGTPDLG